MPRAFLHFGSRGPRICCFSQPSGSPLFSTFDTWRAALLPGRWWAYVHAHRRPTTTLSLLCQALPFQPQLGTKVQRGITAGAFK